MLKRAREEAFKPVDLASLVFLRVAFGLLLAGYQLRALLHGTIERNYVKTIFHFHYFGFEWLRPLPGRGMLWLDGVMVVAAVLLAVGAAYRAAALVFACCFTFQFLIDEAFFINHNYLICLLGFIFAAIPAHRACSVDAWLRPGLRSRTVPAWCLWLVRFQVAVPYVYGAIAKMNGDWLLHGEPMGFYLYMNRSNAVLKHLVYLPGMKFVFAWCGMLFDLLVVPATLWRKTRLLAFAALLYFHVSNSFMFHIGVFPWLMISATTIFWDPAWPRKLLPATLFPESDAPPTPERFRKPILVALALHAAIQLIVPFRHWFYPGDVNWHEQARHFSWHMMLRHKETLIRFRAHDPNSHTDAFINPNTFLNSWQVSQMKKIPDRIHQFARFLGDVLSFGKPKRVEVRVDAYVGLNGRTPERIVDPSVDLGAEPRRWGPAEWILPLATAIPDAQMPAPESETPDASDSMYSD
ncbi:MAG: HTTM domain-containing protein [Deltaproteobacteria bacterium]|nr:HTTM domain-containing protein [Deltaproteobacteria bacterium]